MRCVWRVKKQMRCCTDSPSLLKIPSFWQQIQWLHAVYASCPRQRLMLRQINAYRFCRDVSTGFMAVSVFSLQGEVCIHASRRARLFRRLSLRDKQAYLMSGEWQGKAGGYAIQGQAAIFIRQILGSYSNIVGLDIHRLAGMLMAGGFRFADANRTLT